MAPERGPSLVLLLLALLLPLAPACASTAAAPSPAGRWLLAALPAAADVDVGAAGHGVTLEIGPEGALSGDSGVNRFHGELDAAALARGRFALGPLASTRRAGPPAAMELEQAFLDALTGADAFRLEDGELVLLRDGTPAARLVPAR